MMPNGVAKAAQRAEWWNSQIYLAALVLLSVVPLLWPSLPPLTDALGHLARYHVETALAGSPDLQRYYRFDWLLTGNLGIDLLIVPLTPLFGVELATKLIVLTVPALTAAGLVLVAREIHGRATAFVAFALPLAYGFPFQFGFINYCLSVALALIAFAGWLRLGRAGRGGLRALLFVPIGLLLWLCHIFGWTMLGIMVFAAEWARSRDAGKRAFAAISSAIVAALPLAPPVLLILLWRSGKVAGDTAFWFNLPAKLGWLTGVLRDRWEMFDRGSAALLGFIVLAGGRRFGFTPAGGMAALALLAAFLILPHLLLGSAYADMRLAPFVIAVALIALKPPRERRLAQAIAFAGLAFFLFRTAGTTASYLTYDRAYREQLAAVPYIPHGARVVALVGTACQSRWASARMEHLGGLATVRRDAFVNDQWALKGAQLLSVDYPAAARFARDPSQIVRPSNCAAVGEPPARGLLGRIPRTAFDYVWLINLPGAGSIRRPELTVVWSRADGALYQITPAAPPPLPARPPGSASR